MFRGIVLDIFLPALIGEAALKLSFKKIKENSRAILPLAIVGTSFSNALFYGTYFLSESLHVLGVIAIVTAGLVLGNYVI